ncbi:MAG: hypothetical protein WC563_15535 [Brevundimonas sp.]
MASQYGNVILPVTAGAPAASLIATCDPALYGLGLAFKAILRTQLDAAWQAAAQLIKSEAVAHVVEDVYYREPGRDLASLTWKWPTLALWREDETWEQRTQVYDSCQANVRLAYILPPLDAEHFDRLAPIRKAVSTGIRSLLERLGDPSYLAGVDFIATLGIESIWLRDVQYGSYQTEGNLQLAHPSMRARLELREREMPNTTGVAHWTRRDAAIDLVDATLGNLHLLDDYYTP